MDLLVTVAGHQYPALRSRMAHPTPPSPLAPIARSTLVLTSLIAHRSFDLRTAPERRVRDFPAALASEAPLLWCAVVQPTLLRLHVHSTSWSSRQLGPTASSARPGLALEHEVTAGSGRPAVTVVRNRSLKRRATTGRSRHQPLAETPITSASITSIRTASRPPRSPAQRLVAAESGWI